MITVLDRDNPVNQFKGPMTVATLLAKHRVALAGIIDEELELLESDANLTKGLFDLLYNNANQETREKLVQALEGIDEDHAECLSDAFDVCQTLTPSQKVKSVDYINHFFQADIRFLMDIVPRVENEVEDLDHHPVIDIYEDMRFRLDLQGMRPVPRPEADYLINTLRLFNDIYALNAYVTQYYSTYDNYQAYYGAPYDGNNPGDQLFSLKAYINKRLSEDGISSGSKCYKYKGGRYNDTQLNKIAQSVMSESGVAQNLTLSVAGWKTVFTPYKRTLDKQIIASISECSKSDKSLARLIK